MQVASQRMRSLIQDLLSFSQINKEEIKFGEIDLNEVLKESIQDFEMVIEEKKAIINAQSLPVINGDQRMMRQLFQNIISNSLKYARPSDPPVIAINYQQKAGFLEIVFKDNGIGFDEQHMPQMFNLFQRLHSRDRFEGTGLGLAICKKIVEIHGGKIRAEGKEGEGASFFVSLPTNLLSN